MDKPKIDLPRNRTFTVELDGKASTLITVPGVGCGECYLKYCNLCREMCCCADERIDGVSVQFIRVKTEDNLVVFNTEIDLHVPPRLAKEKENAEAENN